LQPVQKIYLMKSKMFTKEFALVTFGETDAFSGGYAVVQQPHAVTFQGIAFIEGVHALDLGSDNEPRFG
jgi:hypothetical protein